MVVHTALVRAGQVAAVAAAAVVAAVGAMEAASTAALPATTRGLRLVSDNGARTVDTVAAGVGGAEHVAIAPARASAVAMAVMR